MKTSAATAAEIARTLEVLNRSIAILKEVRALPQQTEISLRRAFVAQADANHAARELNACMETDALLGRLLALP